MIDLVVEGHLGAGYERDARETTATLPAPGYAALADVVGLVGAARPVSAPPVNAPTAATHWAVARFEARRTAPSRPRE
jgi:hypothetical protein